MSWDIKVGKGRLYQPGSDTLAHSSKMYTEPSTEAQNEVILIINGKRYQTKEMKDQGLVRH